MHHRARFIHVGIKKTIPQYQRDQKIKSTCYRCFDPNIEATALSRLLSLSATFVSSDELLQTRGDCLEPLAWLSKVVLDTSEFLNLSCL